MPISIMQWHVEIGIFNIRFYIRCRSNAIGPLTLVLCTIAGVSITLLSLFLLLYADVELNLGPNKKRNSSSNFSICHWNLNSLTANNFEKVNLLEAYSTSPLDMKKFWRGDGVAGLGVHQKCWPICLAD